MNKEALKQLENDLWKSANTLRANSDLKSTEYSTPVMGRERKTNAWFGDYVSEYNFQQAKLERKFAKEVEVIRRDDRLETIAMDIVYHFPRRGYLGKGMVVSVEKFTTVRMYEKVQRLWKEKLKTLRSRINQSGNELEKYRLKKIVDYMRFVDMAVVVSAETGEEEKFKARGLDIKLHRTRMGNDQSIAVSIFPKILKDRHDTL